MDKPKLPYGKGINGERLHKELCSHSIYDRRKVGRIYSKYSSLMNSLKDLPENKNKKILKTFLHDRYLATVWKSNLSKDIKYRLCATLREKLNDK